MIRCRMIPAYRHLTRLGALAALVLLQAAGADVLPDDRADLFYSKYSGGGMDITGESALVRKKITENFAVEANYFVDKVSGASVDVLSNASVIKDERKQKTGTVEYLHDKTTYTASFINSTERDYISNTTHLALSQDMFGDLTTLTLGWSRTRDQVGENDGTAFVPRIVWLGHAESQSYDVGVSQILMRNLIAGLNFEVITDDGYLARDTPWPARSIPTHAPARRSRPRPSTTCHGAQRSRACTDTTTIPGTSPATRTSWTTRIRSPTSGSSRDGSATTGRDMPTSTATSFPLRYRRISRRATRISRRRATPPSAPRSPTPFSRTAGRSSSAPQPRWTSAGSLSTIWISPTSRITVYRSISLALNRCTISTPPCCRSMCRCSSERTSVRRATVRRTLIRRASLRRVSLRRTSSRRPTAQAPRP